MIPKCKNKQKSKNEESTKYDTETFGLFFLDKTEAISHFYPASSKHPLIKYGALMEAWPQVLQVKKQTLLTGFAETSCTYVKSIPRCIVPCPYLLLNGR